MSDGAPEASIPSSPTQTTEPSATEHRQSTDEGQIDRTGLIARAKSFLQSAPVRLQDFATKKRFLSEKGLTEDEIASLVYASPSQPPSIPPRTYPQPAPSNLLNLLVGILRLFSWIVGGSAVALLVYQKLLLPRISRTMAARTSLRSHQLALLKKFNTSAQSVKDQHGKDLSHLPHTDPYAESEHFRDSQSVQDVLSKLESRKILLSDLEPVTLLRCALHDYAKAHGGTMPTTQELFQVMEGQIPWLLSEDGVRYEERLWTVLNDCPSFQPTSELVNDDEVLPESQTWTYVAPPSHEQPKIVSSLEALRAAIPQPAKEESTRQHTHKALTDLTGYISSHVYAPSYRPMHGLGVGQGMLTPQQDELRREIRALKGLVLNRRSFMAPITRTQSSSPQPTR